MDQSKRIILSDDECKSIETIFNLKIPFSVLETRYAETEFDDGLKAEFYLVKKDKDKEVHTEMIVKSQSGHKLLSVNKNKEALGIWTGRLGNNTYQVDICDWSILYDKWDRADQKEKSGNFPLDINDEVYYAKDGKVERYHIRGAFFDGKSGLVEAVSDGCESRWLNIQLINHMQWYTTRNAAETTEAVSMRSQDAKDCEH